MEEEKEAEREKKTGRRKWIWTRRNSKEAKKPAKKELKRGEGI